MLVYESKLTSVLGIILCNQTVKAMILNNSRSLMFSGAPSFHMLAAIRAGYKLLRAGKTEEVSRDKTSINFE